MISQEAITLHDNSINHFLRHIFIQKMLLRFMLYFLVIEYLGKIYYRVSLGVPFL